MTDMKKPNLSKEQALDMVNNSPVIDVFTKREDRPVLCFEYKQKNYVVKFSAPQQATRHENNTELFRFFGLPFVPCTSFDIDYKDIKETIRNHVKKPYLNGLVVMPLVKGKELDPLVNSHSAMALSYTPHVIATSCLDAAENILVKKSSGNESLIYLDARMGAINYPDSFKMDERVENVLYQETGKYITYFERGLPKEDPLSQFQQSFEDFSNRYIPLVVKSTFPESLAGIQGLQKSLIERLEVMGNIDISRLAKHCP